MRGPEASRSAAIDPSPARGVRLIGEAEKTSRRLRSGSADIYLTTAQDRIMDRLIDGGPRGAGAEELVAAVGNAFSLNALSSVRTNISYLRRKLRLVDLRGTRIAFDRKARRYLLLPG